MEPVLNIIGDEIGIIDPDYNVIFENSKCEEAHGSNLNKKCYQAYSKSDTICDGCPAQEVFKTGKVVTKVMHTPLPNSEAPTVEIVASPILNDKGEVVACLEVVRDLTEQARADKEKEALIAKLEHALNEVKVLQGIIPICSKCKKIKDNKGYWHQVEKYIAEHSNAVFSHGLCIDCADIMYKGQDWYDDSRDELNDFDKKKN